MNQEKQPTALDALGGVGKKCLVIALGAMILVPLVLSLMFYPTAHMELKGLPFGVLSLDEGATFPAGSVNVGNTLVEKIESGGLSEMIAASGSAEPSSENGASLTAGLSGAISFKALDSQAALDEAFSRHELYGALVVPEDFSEAQIKAMVVAQASLSSIDTAASAEKPREVGVDSSRLEVAQAADVQKPTIQVVIDYAKSPMVGSQMQTAMASMLGGASAPFAVEVTTINAGPAASDGASGNMMSGMLSQMVVLMPLLVCSIVAGIFAVKGAHVRSGQTVGARVRAYALSLAVDLVAAAILALMLFWVVRCIAGLAVEFGSFFVYCWLVSFFLMVFFGGLACVQGWLAGIVGALILLLGMTSAYLPFEALPAFWQDWVAPWVPELYMGNGLREVVFAGGSAWNAGTVCAGIYGLVGACVAAAVIGAGGRCGGEPKKRP